MSNLPVPLPEHTPAPGNVIYAYPITPPPQQSLTDAGALVMEVLAIFNEAGDKLQRALQRPYPCAICQENLAGKTAWEQRRHFNGHPLRDQARVVGWVRAVIGT